MTDSGYTTITVQEETKERLSDVRGEDFKNWDAFLNDLADYYQQNVEPVYAVGSDQPVDSITTDTDDGLDLGFDMDTLDSIQSSIETVEQRTGNIERTLEDLQR